MSKVSLSSALAGQLTELEPEIVVAPVDAAPEPPAAAPVAAVEAPAAPKRPRKPRKRAAAVVAAPEPEPGLPRYLTLERVEGRLRLDQLDDLSALTRRLNRARGRGVGERLTNNTLIRLGVDLILASSDALAGATEEELRRSLGLPDLQTPVDA